MSLKVFLQSMTVWNWLAVAAFLTAIVSFVNAFLSLKSRYRNWKAIRSEEQFQKRIRQLIIEWKLLERGRENPVLFIYEMASVVLVVSLGLVGCFFVFVIAQLISLYARPVAVVLYLLIALMLLANSANLQMLSRRMANIARKGEFVADMLSVLKKGASKGWSSEVSSELIATLTQSKVLDDEERAHISNHISQNSPIDGE